MDSSPAQRDALRNLYCVVRGPVINWPRLLEIPEMREAVIRIIARLEVARESAVGKAVAND